MKERPILFSAPMVLAILAGRKTQTRRIIKPQPMVSGPPDFWRESLKPYAEVGSRLWVRETWAPADTMYKGHEQDPPSVVAYRADESACFMPNTPDERWVPREDTHGDASCNFSALKWKPSIFMPRAASRITLEVTGIRVERLHDLTDADALAEGCQSNEDQPGPRGYRFAPDFPWDSRPRDAFRRGWNELHRGKRSHLWFTDAKGDVRSPFVWVFTFKRVNQ